ncbi:MAG TPA: hypothetical protein VHA30_04010 [Patescibacteria group bacterium]|nr:hypothetical protein [Patescibacteria group bacterium]
MTSFQDIISLAKADGGKFFIMDEQGNPQLIIMSIEEYQRLLLNKLQQQVTDVEKINREILEAQLDEHAAEEAVKTSFRGPTVTSQGQADGRRQSVDLRAEVIDPSFDFEGPKNDLEDL